MKPVYKELERQLSESRREFWAADATINNLEMKLAEMAAQLSNAESKCAALAADNEKAMEAMRQADAAVKLANEKFSALAAENAALKQSEKEFNDFCREEFSEWEDDVTETPATDAFLAEVRAHDLNAFIRYHSAELDAHIKNGGEQFDEKSVRIRDIIVSARLFREQIRKEAVQ